LSADLSAAVPGTLRKAGFTPPEWPTSFRNAGRLHPGTVAGFKSESMAGFRRNHQAMLEAHGIAAGTAAEMLLLVGDNPDRIRSEAAFAKLCGACPIPASSGKTNRHRLNRGGNRQANAALYRVVIVRMRGHQPTLDYVRRRTAEGKGKMEIIRCLKRFVAREIFGYLCGQPKSTLVAQSDP
jgi:hypothetical protein